MTSIGDALGHLWQADDRANMLQQDGQWVSWGRVRALADQLDEQLGAAGCRAGGRVAVVLGNRMESVAALIAIMRGDRTLVTISPLQPVERLSADLVATGAAFVLAPGALWSEDELCVGRHRARRRGMEPGRGSAHSAVDVGHRAVTG